MIGVFWLHRFKLYFKAIASDKIKAIDNFKDSDFAHYQVWDEISFQNKDFYLYEYEDIPRGRVVFDIRNNLFIVYSNKELISSPLANKLIIEAFELDKMKVSFEYDEHYNIFVETI